MNILLLGATGYLGGNIANRLSLEGHNVVCVVRSQSDISNLKYMNVELISNDLKDIETRLVHGHIDWIINGICRYKTNETLYGDLLDANVFFPLNILNLAIKCGIKNFITMGTSLPEYLDMYSFSKMKFAQFGEYLSQKEGINFVNLQLEMFYGGLFEPDDRFIGFCKKKLISGNILELTEGSQKRDIVHVEDVTNIISTLVRLDYVRGYRILPIGSGEHHSIREILEFMKDVIGSGSELKFGKVSSRKGEPDTCADISWYGDIGYKLKFDFWSGLREECQN